MTITPKTSSQNEDVCDYRLRRCPLKMMLSPETSPEHRDVEKGRVFLFCMKMSVSSETSSNTWYADRGVLLSIMLKMLFLLGTSSENKQEHGRRKTGARQKVRISHGTSSTKWDVLNIVSTSFLRCFNMKKLEPKHDPKMAPRAPWRLPKMTISLGTSSTNWKIL